MPLYDIENVGYWTEGGFIGAQVIAPTEKRALALVSHLTGNIDLRDLRVKKIPVTGEQLLSTQFND